MGSTIICAIFLVSGLAPCVALLWYIQSNLLAVGTDTLFGILFAAILGLLTYATTLAVYRELGETLDFDSMGNHLYLRHCIPSREL